MYSLLGGFEHVKKSITHHPILGHGGIGEVIKLNTVSTTVGEATTGPACIDCGARSVNLRTESFSRLGGACQIGHASVFVCDKNKNIASEPRMMETTSNLNLAHTRYYPLTFHKE
jgi:threonine dehydrogenase-like Zn-dependent dehydrogenase